MRPDIKAVGFDLDGTLYPNYSLNFKLIPFSVLHGRLLLAFGKARSIIRNEQEHSSAFPLPDLYNYQALITAQILHDRADIIREKIDQLMYQGWEQVFKTVKLFAHAADTLKALKKAGLKLGLLSDFPPENKLQHMGLSGIWDTVLCSERFGVIKPHARPFAKLAEALGLPAEKILYVGNSIPFDVAGASRAGMKTAWIKNRLARNRKKQPIPDFTFSDYRQLHNYMLG